MYVVLIIILLTAFSSTPVVIVTVPLAFRYSPLPPNICDTTSVPGLKKFCSDRLVKASLKNNAPSFKKNVQSSISKVI